MNQKDMNYLKHHGIKGQKWGVRNGPPYPLGASDHSASEKQAGWTKSLSKTTPSTSSAQTHKTPAAKTSSGSLMNKKVSELSGVSDQAIQLGVYAVTLLGAYSAAALSRHISYRNDIKKNQNQNDLSNIPKIKGKHSEEQDVKAINPNYSTGQTKYRMNCTMCSAAYELRRRGYDVQASTTTQGRYSKDVASWFGLTKNDISKTKTYDDFYDALHSEPDGARGQILVGVGMFDSKHSMVWEKKGNKIVIRDCQSGTTYDSIESSIVNKNSRHQYEYIRTDNAAIDYDKIRDAVQVRNEKKI